MIFDTGRTTRLGTATWTADDRKSLGSGRRTLGKSCVDGVYQVGNSMAQVLWDSFIPVMIRYGKVVRERIKHQREEDTELGENEPFTSSSLHLWWLSLTAGD